MLKESVRDLDNESKKMRFERRSNSEPAANTHKR